MTGTEKIARIMKIQESGKAFGLSYKENEEVLQLREGIKVSDWFKHNATDDTSIEPFYKVFGFSVNAGGRFNQKLENAVSSGYVKIYQFRSYGRYTTRIKLTAKGKKLLA